MGYGMVTAPCQHGEVLRQLRARGVTRRAGAWRSPWRCLCAAHGCARCHSDIAAEPIAVASLPELPRGMVGDGVDVVVRIRVAGVTPV